MIGIAFQAFTSYRFLHAFAIPVAAFAHTRKPIQDDTIQKPPVIKTDIKIKFIVLLRL